MPLHAARETLLRAAAALEVAAGRLDASFALAVDLLAGPGGGRVVTTGIGKSGHVAARLAASLRAVGVPAGFLQAAEAAHGDQGMAAAGDTLVAVSQSGESPEVIAVARAVRAGRGPIVVMTGSARSTLAREAAVVLDTGCGPEAGGFLPTTSTTVAGAVGDALVVAVAARLGSGPGRLAELHPGGALGRRLRVRVRDLLPVPAPNPSVPLGASMAATLDAVDRGRSGAVSVVRGDGAIAGIVTDGDLRRAALRAGPGLLDLRVEDVMTRDPVVVSPDAPAASALALMEDRPSQIAVLPVVETATSRPIGLLRLHDVVRAGV